MSEVLHTPGPWWATDSGVRDSGGYIFHTNPVTHYPGQDERYAKEVAEREANKAAAAALPELLEAMKGVIAAWDRLYPSMPVSEAYEDCEFREMQAARRALAKATTAHTRAKRDEGCDG